MHETADVGYMRNRTVVPWHANAENNESGRRLNTNHWMGGTMKLKLVHVGCVYNAHMMWVREDGKIMDLGQVL
jgi:hypothetical protein